MKSLNAHNKQSRILLACGIIAPLLYIVTDLTAASLYEGYNFRDQAVSELFAIGAPTSLLVVIFFSISSFLYLLFGWGVWYSSGASRLLKWMAFMLWGNAINSLLLWIFFPMHMRGEPPTFTDTMHGILAINPFVLVTIILGAIYFKNWFRYFSFVIMLMLLLSAAYAFSIAPLVFSNQPTPGMGTTERISQYAHQLWHSLLAVQLLRQRNNSSV